MTSIQIDKESSGKRLDTILSAHSEIYSRSAASRLIKSGLVKINGSTDGVLSSRKTKLGDTIQFIIGDTQCTPLPKAVPYDLDIVHEDDDILVLNKPKGMVVHPAPGHSEDTLVNYLLYHGKLTDNTDSQRPGIVHRLDKDTTGLLVVAKNDLSALRLTEQFAAHSIKRSYTAVVWGCMEEKRGTIDKPIGRHPRNRKKQAVVDNGRPAITHWRVKAEFPPFLSLVQCSLETGRTHQIRVHLSSIGHPVLGDPLYGKKRDLSRSLPENITELLSSFNTQALHAKTLGFTHPGTSQWIEFDSPLPRNMQKLIDAIWFNS